MSDLNAEYLETLANLNRIMQTSLTENKTYGDVLDTLKLATQETERERDSFKNTNQDLHKVIDGLKSDVETHKKANIELATELGESQNKVNGLLQRFKQIASDNPELAKQLLGNK